MSQDLLKAEGVATVQKIFPGEGVAEDMGGAPLAVDTSLFGTLDYYRLHSPHAQRLAIAVCKHRPRGSPI
jgi:hypothetical protein